MSILLDLGADQRSNIVSNPLPMYPTSFTERFELNFERERATGLEISEQRNLYLRYEREIETYRGITGQTLRNPMAGGYDSVADNLTSDGATRHVMRRRIRESDTVAYDAAVRQAMQQFPDSAEVFRDSQQVSRAAREDAVAAFRAAEAQDRVGGGGFGGFLGTVAAVMSDPLQIATLPLGAGRLAGGVAMQILRGAAIEGGIAAGTQLAVEATATPYRVGLGLPANFGDNILEAAVGGAVIGGGLRGLVAGWQWARGRSSAPDGAAALREDDSARMLGDMESRRAGNPAGAGGAVAHEAVVGRAVDQMIQGRLLSEAEVAPIARRVADMEGEPGTMRVFTPSGRAVAVQPEVVELRSLIPSHLDGGAVNPAFPHAEGLQPRERGAAPSQDQIREIASRLEPERMAPNREAGFGAPIIGPDQVVESGNGRILALRQVYGDGALAANRQAYQDWLAKQGFDTAGYSEPVLISRRVSALAPDERRAFAEEANGRGTLAQGAAETARADARIVDGILQHYRGGAVDLAQNAEFVRRFMAGLTAADRGNLIRADGTISAAGVRRIRGATLARAYGDEAGPLLARFLDGDAEGLKNIAGALEDVAGGWATMRAAAAWGEINPGMDTTADLLAAVRTVDNARRLKRPVAEMVAQFDLDAPVLTDAGRAMLAAMHRDPGFRNPAGRALLTKRLNGYLDEAMKSQPGRDMFGAPAVRAEEALAGQIARHGDEGVDPMAGRQMALREAADARTQALETPRIEDAEIAEARRIAAAQDIGVPTGTGDDITVKSASELLKHADQEVAGAAQAAACLLGAAV